MRRLCWGYPDITSALCSRFLGLVNNPGYLGPTVAGKKHDKKAADEEEIPYPTNTTLAKDTGFQGYEPAGGLTRQPKKTERPGVERGGQIP